MQSDRQQVHRTISVTAPRAGEVPVPDEPPGRQDASACPPPDCPARAVQPEELALDLTSEAVRLLARDAGGSWTEIGAVPLAAGDFRVGIDALRSRADAIGELPVTLWLPPDQVHVRRYVLKRGSHEAQVLRRLAEDTGHGADELTIALSAAGDGELVTVLGAFKQTVAEALDYARRWGFRPGRVSTRVEAERFGADGPSFALPDPAARPAGIGARRALAASAGLLALGVGAWGAWGIWGAYGLLPASEPPPVVVASAPEIAVRVADEETGSPEVPPSPVGRQEAGEFGPPKAGRPAAASLPKSLPEVAATAIAPGLPPELAPADSDAPVRRGRAPAAAERRQLADRAELPAAEASADLAPLLAGIDRIRAEPPEPSAPEDPVLLAASDIAPVTVPGRPVPRPAGGADPAAADVTVEEAPEEEGSDVPPPPAEVSDSRLAAVHAPRPPARPDSSNGPAPLERVAAHRAAGTAPPRVGNAAAQRGIALDATSLIGVIDANSGREALLRMPSGDFLKVARGDEVAGWRVNAIGQDAMRLTRGGESRTLLLVTR